MSGSTKLEANEVLVSLGSGKYTLQLTRHCDGTAGLVILKDLVKLHQQNSPLILRIKTLKGAEESYYGTYREWSLYSGIITAKGSVTTAAGSRFDYVDKYYAQGSGETFLMERVVTVGAIGEMDVGFATRYAMNPLASSSLADYEIFAPGNWYKQNTNVVRDAIASDYGDANFLIKESRLTLPLVAMRARETGEAMTFIHQDAVLSTEQSESTTSWLVHGGFQFGSMGITKLPQLALNYVYPSTEGDRNYYGADMKVASQLTGQVRRSHPVALGFSHTYKIVIKLGQTPNFPDFQSQTWNYAFHLYAPTTRLIDANILYANAMSYYSAVFKCFRNSAAGLPWSSWATETGGTAYHLQSGFVGQQAKVGWQLLREGYRTNNAEMSARGTAIIDFWVNASMTTAGIPLTDYFAESGTWGLDPLFLRTVSDAGEGVVDAYNTAYNRGDCHRKWLGYARKLGDFLVTRQASDGSWARSYNNDGTVHNAGKFNTTNPIRFLIKLYLTTSDERFSQSAIAAGEWAKTNVDEAYSYVGGTPDNDNTIDKEAGVMALNAFNALFDLTGDRRWLEAAKNAANYVESWTFCYNYDVYPSTRWTANGPVYPSWLQVDLEAPTIVERVETMFEFGDTGYSYLIETSQDGVLWSIFGDKAGIMAKPRAMSYIDEGSALARFVKITVTGCASNAWPSIYEFRVYGPSGSDLAQGKPTSASSELDNTHVASRATSGVITSDPHSPWPSAELIGQSLVATGHSYTDTFMINCPAEFYRLYVASGDTQYLDFANLIANNANAPADYDGRLGYQYRALLGEGIMANNFTVYYGAETLTWQTAVQLESIVMLEDMFGYKNIADIESHLSADEKQTRNHLAHLLGVIAPACQTSIDKK